MRLEAQITREKGRTTVVMSGWMDERSEWPQLGPPVKGHLLLDLREITLLNSMGVRGWVLWLASLKVDGDVILVHCSPTVLKQITILEGFLNDRTKIGSICVPYFCEDCSREENLLIDITSLPKPPTFSSAVSEFNCSVCGMNMHLDMVESQFMNFLNAHRAKFTAF